MRRAIAVLALLPALAACAEDSFHRERGRGPRPCGPCVASEPIAGADLSLPVPPPMDDAKASSAAGAAPAEPGAPAAPYVDADTPALPPAVAAVSAPRAWKVIVLHHSASEVGGAARFDGWHRAKGWDGVGYDFVVGNGTDTPDGEIETTARWTAQKDGAHVKGWNDVSIGICLVGNFESADPTAKQLDAVVRLVRHLRRRFHVPPERVVGHGTLGATLCPGKRFSVPDVVAKSDPAAAPAPARAP